MPAPAPATAPLTACPRCDRRARPDDLACGLCGEVLRRAPREAGPAPTLAPDRADAPAPGSSARERIAGLPPRAFVLLCGFAAAPVLLLTPLLRYMGWFLGSLVHETGHVAVALACGCPAFPGIRLDGHAAAVHRDPVPLLWALVVASLLALAWANRRRGARLAAFVGLSVLYPFLAVPQGPRQALFLVAGHAGEVAFAAWALREAVRGGFSGTTAERCAHAGVGWYLLGRNLVLGVGLWTSLAARIDYLGNGSFGLENDLVRLAREVRGLSLPAAGALLAAGALAVCGTTLARALRARA